MKTKSLDVVYFVSAFAKKDLKYSIRSVAKNLEYNKLIVYGGKNYNITPDLYQKNINQIGATKWDKVKNMYREVCEDDRISEDFILFHDDFFIMKPISELNIEYRGTLEEHIQKLKDKYGDIMNEYCKLLAKADGLLKDLGKSRYSYELHKPFIFNRKKLLEILELFGNYNCIRSIYANYYGLGGVKAHDVKIFNNRPSFDYKEEPILSTDDSILRDNNQYWDYIKSQFRDKCKYEML